MAGWRAMDCRAPLLALLLLPGVAFAGGIVDAEFVAKALARGAIAWDVRGADEYANGHLPGAVSVGHVSQAIIDPKTQLLRPAAEIERVWGGAGIDPAREIVVYGLRGSAFAYFAQFALEAFGAGNVSVFHDGVDAWRAAGHPVSTSPTVRERVELKLPKQPALPITTDEVVEKVGRNDVQFVDTRRLGEFVGKESETLHAGHIPGAVHILYSRNYRDPETPLKLMRKETTDTAGMALKPDDELRKLYAGLDPGKETIVYCHTGIRAALTTAVLKRLGFRNVKLYYASWLEYGNRPRARVETALPPAPPPR